jgi:hypothetical protein
MEVDSALDHTWLKNKVVVQDIDKRKKEKRLKFN